MEDKGYEEYTGRWGEEETATDELVQVGFSEELILELKPIWKEAPGHGITRERSCQGESKYKDSLYWKVRVKFFLLSYRDGLNVGKVLRLGLKTRGAMN